MTIGNVNETEMTLRGLDVDDTQHHGSAFNSDTGEVCDFKCRPTLEGLLNQLDNWQDIFQTVRSGCVTRRDILTIVQPPDAELEQDRPAESS